MNFLSRWQRRSVAQAGAVYVTERSGVRSLHIGSDTIQSSMRLARPNDLELAYTRSMMGFLLFAPPPRRALLVGLGGGSLAKFIYHRMPGTQIEVLEVSPDVVSIARRYFHLPAADGRLEIRVCDAAQFMARPGEPYDAILCDGYDGDSLVEALSSRAFFGACLKRLAPGGIAAVNLWGSDRRFDEYLASFEDEFPAGTLCLPAEKPGNVIAFGFRDAPHDVRWADLGERAAVLEARYGLEFRRFVAALRRMNRSDAERLYPGDSR